MSGESRKRAGGGNGAGGGGAEVVADLVSLTKKQLRINSKSLQMTGRDARALVSVLPLLLLQLSHRLPLLRFPP